MGRAAAFALAVAAVLAVAACWAGLASAATGTLEICKAPDNGANGVVFKFTATNLNTGAAKTVSVKGGSCSIAMPAGTAKWSVQENLSSGIWNVTAVNVVPGAAIVKDSVDLGDGLVGVKVTAGVETQVIFTNAQAMATLKVCKWSSTPSIQGSTFTFNINNTVVSAVAGDSKADAGCSSPLVYQPGSIVTMTEAVPSGERVADIAVAGNLRLNSSAGGTAKITIGSGVNIVYFDNEPLSPPQLGYIEVCKDAGDQFTTGTYTFTITDSAHATDTEQIPVGQCSGPIQVASGNVSVVETPTPNEYVQNIFTYPSTSLGPYNLTNGAATVVVPVSPTTDNEVQVHFVNAAQLATLKVCKVLTSSSAALAGATFNFTIASSAGPQSSLSIIASTSPNGACKNFGLGLPIGSSVTVSETGVAFVGANGGAPGAGASSTVTLAPGINSVSFTNQAYGTVEICKNMQAGDEAYNGTFFNFSVNGGTAFGVAAGRCSGGITLPVGSATISEASKQNFAFVSATATGPLGDSRVISGTNPLVVSVPYPGGSGNETLVTFTNRVLRSVFKICKLIDPGSTTALGGLNYSFNWSYLANGATTSGTATVTPPYDSVGGSCTGLIGSVPIINQDGSPTLITVTETGLGANYQVTTIAVDNGTTTQNTPATGTVSLNPNVGVVAITFTNAAL